MSFGDENASRPGSPSAEAQTANVGHTRATPAATTGRAESARAKRTTVLDSAHLGDIEGAFPSTRLNMIALRAYLIIGALLLVVKAIQSAADSLLRRPQRRRRGS